MSFYIKDPATDEAVRKLAKLKGTTLTETIRHAVEHEFAREAKLPLSERIEPILRRIQSYPRTGLEADKAFFDEMSGDN